MATAEEILEAAFASEAITVDVENRKLIIPSTLEHIGVESDEDVFKVPFILPRYYGSIDFADAFEINVNITNAGGQPDVYTVEDAEISDDAISFSWLVGRYAAAYPGEVTISLCLKKYEEDDRSLTDKEFNTEPEKLYVKKGHETSKAFVEKNPEVITKLCDIINGLTERVIRLERLVGLGDTYGYSKITFEDGVLVISPGGPGGSDGSDIPTYPDTPDGSYEPEEPSITYTLFGKWVFNETTPMPDEAFYITSKTMKTGASYGVSVTMLEANANGITYVMSGKKTNVADSDGEWLEDGYRYIDFGEEGIVVDDTIYGWFTTNASEYVNVDEGESYRLYVSNGYGTSIYVNGNEDTPMMVTSTAIAECRNVRKFKFTTDNVEFSFVSGAPSDDDGVIIVLEPDENGWYTLTQNTTVKVTAGGEYSRRVTNTLANCTTDNSVRATMLGGPYKATLHPVEGYYISSVSVIMNGVDVTAGAYLNGVIDIPEVTGDIVITADAIAFTGTKYQLYTFSPLASYVYINLDDTTPVAILAGATNIHGVSKVKFAGANISGATFYSGIGTGSFVDTKLLDLEPDEDGWYTLTEDTSARLEGKDIDPDALMLYGKWIFNETVTLPEDIVSMSGTQMFTGPGFGEVITQIAAHKDAGMLYGNEETGTSIKVIDENGAWVDVRYRSVDFGNAGEAVNEDFYRWIMLNAVNDDSEYVSIVADLTNCSSSNDIIGAVKGGSYSTILSTADGYKITSVKVTMGGEDVTDSVYSVGLVSIPEITGDIVITAKAVKMYKLTGKWLFNTTLSLSSLTSSGGSVEVSDISAKTGTDYSIEVTHIQVWSTGMSYACPTMITVAPSNNNGVSAVFTTSNTKYRYLDFGTDGISVDEYFYNWFVANSMTI